MSSVVSFPNLLCLLLTGVLIIHISTRTPIEGSFPKIADDLEVIFCKVPQSRRVEDLKKCSSAQKLFTLLKNGCSFERKMIKVITKTNKTEIEEDKQTVVAVEVEEETILEETKATEDKPEEEIRSSLVDSFIISLLVCSAIASLVEWHRERSRREEKTNGEGFATSGTGTGDGVIDRRISLVDLTVNRHIRRQDSQQADALRQNSTQGSRPPLLRRSSFPAQIPEGRRPPPQRQQSIPATRRMSIDLEDDGSPDRRRVRIIRRH